MSTKRIMAIHCDQCIMGIVLDLPNSEAIRRAVVRDFRWTCDERGDFCEVHAP